MDWTTIAGVAAVLVPVAALIAHALGILEKLSSLVAKVWNAVFRSRDPAAHPSQTLIIVQMPRSNALWWHMGHTGKGGPQPPLPLMQVCADVNVTNIWTSNVYFANAVLRYRPWWSPFRRRELGHANIFSGGDRPIPPKSMEWVRASFMFKNPWRKAGQPFVADLGIVDQFNNHHWLRNIRFPYH